MIPITPRLRKPITSTLLLEYKKSQLSQLNDLNFTNYINIYKILINYHHFILEFI